MFVCLPCFGCPGTLLAALYAMQRSAHMRPLRLVITSLFIAGRAVVLVLLWLVVLIIVLLVFHYFYCQFAICDTIQVNPL